MEYNELIARYLYWQGNAEGTVQEELEAIAADDKEIEDRFYCDLSFGTAGMRGRMGAGTNRMNHYMVRRATRGLATYIDKHGGKTAGAAIAYDTRHHSAEYALEAARTLCDCGIKTYLFRIPSATPLLSYALRRLGCAAGIVISASHNPKEDNGYKVYDQYGCQMIPEAANEVAAYVWESSPFGEIISEEAAKEQGLLIDLGEEMQKEFCYETMKQSHPIAKEAVAALKTVFTPLHGTGYVPISFVLKAKGYPVSIVPEQAAPDGGFPTVKKPNPEEHDALAMGIAQAEREDADLVLGTDPDCDRVGVAVKTEEGYRLLNGNQIGALLIHYVLTRRKEKLKKNAVILKSIVTNDFGAAVAKTFGVETVETLTGFKYIGEAMTAYEKSGEKDFVLGYEESYGFLIGKHVRDKDAVVSSLLICEMAAYYKEKGFGLYDILASLHHRFGFYLDSMDSVTFPGSAGMARMKEIMASLRGNETLFGAEQVRIDDYIDGLYGLPGADVLKYVFADGSWVAVRPSGTEPKLKIYYSVRAKNEREAAAKTMSLSDIMLEAVE
ncbi:MAG TPA: phospho-sugar mutase [Clostridiales bacterium]|nr:phospho-sugar mutase [Clostridiales bacterium]